MAREIELYSLNIDIIVLFFNKSGRSLHFFLSFGNYDQVEPKLSKLKT